MTLERRVDDDRVPADPSDVLPGSPAWLQFEKDVESHIAARFEDVNVTHDSKMLGRISGRQRQVDVLVEGTFAGSRIQVVVECKRNASKPLVIGVVDAFAGKLQDIGAEKGVLWAFGGVDSGARARAEGAINPRIEVRTLDDFLSSHEIPDEFFNPADCPNPNCWGGEVGWHDLTAQESNREFEAGYCESCGTHAGKCPECGEITVLDWDGMPCDGCGAHWSVFRFSDGEVTVDWSSAVD